jgi:hypothetical protein
MKESVKTVSLCHVDATYLELFMGWILNTTSLTLVILHVSSRVCSKTLIIRGYHMIYEPMP